MSVEWMNRVFKHSQSTLAARLVLLALADNVNNDSNGECWPSLVTLAEKAKVNRRTVQRSIDLLVEMGEVEVVKIGAGTRSSRYRLLVPYQESLHNIECGQNVAVTNCPPENTKKVVTNCLPSGDKLSQQENIGVTSTTREVAICPASGGEMSPKPEGTIKEPEGRAGQPLKSFILKSGENWEIPQNVVQELLSNFGGCLDVVEELRLAAEWTEENPAKRKTATGMLRFVRRWIREEVKRVSLKQRQFGRYAPPVDNQKAVSAALDFVALKRANPGKTNRELAEMGAAVGVGV